MILCSRNFVCWPKLFPFNQIVRRENWLLCSIKLRVLPPNNLLVGSFILHRRVTDLIAITLSHNFANSICEDLPLFFRVFAIPVMLPKVFVRRKDREFKLLGLAEKVLAKGDEHPIPHIHDITCAGVTIHTRHDVNERLNRQQVVESSFPKLDNLLSIRGAALRENHQWRSFSFEAKLLAVKYLFENCFSIVLV